MSGVEAAFGLTASCLTLADFVKKIHDLYVDVKDAEKEWQRYREGFEAVVMMKSAVGTILAKHPDISRLPIEVEGEKNPVLLVDRLQDKFSAVMKDANNLLRRSTQVSTGRNENEKGLPEGGGQVSTGEKSSRGSDLTNWVRFLFRARKVLRLVLDKDTVIKLMDRVEDALNHLHMGLTLVSLESSASWQSHTTKVLEEIKAKLGQKKPEDSDWLEDRPITVELQVFVDTSARGDRHSGKTYATKPRSMRASIKGHVQGFRQKIKLNPAPSKGKKFNKSRRDAEVLGHSISQEVENVDGGQDADDESSDDEEQYDLNVTDRESQETSHNTSCKTKYELIVDTNNERLIQAPVASETDQLARSLQDGDASRTCPVPFATAVRLKDVLETKSESEWEETLLWPVPHIMDYLTSAPSTAYTTDAEVTANGLSHPITINSNNESHNFIADDVDLKLSKGEAGGKFCVERISVADNTQVFCVIQPCAGSSTTRCKHVTIQIANLDVFVTRKLPTRIEIASLLFSGRNSHQPYDSSSWQKGSAASFPCGRRKRPPNSCTKHTVMDQDDWVECAWPVDLLACLQPATDDSDTKTERGLCESGDEGAKTENDQRESQSIPPGSGCSADADTVDNKFAFNLLQKIVFDETFDPPRSVTLDTLVRFLNLIDKHSWCVEKKPLDQAKAWASGLRPPEVLNRDAVPWLWITWKLRMKDDFKKLSTLIQRQAVYDISSWQDGPENTYNIRLPHSILNPLAQRRIDALSRIRDKWTSLMDRYREGFVSARDHVLHGHMRRNADIVISSLAFGYLKLETDRCLELYNPDRHDEKLADFAGASFAEVKECICMMEELGDWEISYAPLDTPFDVPFARFSVSIPLVGKILHERRHFGLRVGFKDDLKDLIQQIELESWGLDLDRIEE